MKQTAEVETMNGLCCQCGLNMYIVCAKRGFYLRANGGNWMSRLSIILYLDN